jgi:hypothetical protein
MNIEFHIYIDLDNELAQRYIEPHNNKRLDESKDSSDDLGRAIK